MLRSGAKLTDYVNCTRGVEQGDVGSPVLFFLFINELDLEIIHNWRHGATLTRDVVELFILLLADDTVVLSDHKIVQAEQNMRCCVYCKIYIYMMNRYIDNCFLTPSQPRRSYQGAVLNNSLDVYLKLFDAQVQSIAQYGAEL